ncbi:MAG TPA: 3'-5' exonuclease [Tenuifilaceae bacterium]|jgi:ribonuclease D|nr:3'-5' exonuclease domain-containing protein 2 [Bacteroidales bacterium]HNT42551.1 3'-5' exonuclease [Tenuifilaceae bacterium]MBP8643965.1 3'-5' exonuclease domain-containing protein 2 [Bacteroidales bacterium]NLI88506.1 3'-5' exonuclease domain-containing protein 2 [Bacteroidales bacterium]HNY08273.1 3'-5' exonuclease [Tenuifilaceae bacterium]
MFATSISNEEIAKLPRLVFEGETVVVSENNHLERCLAELSNSRLVGFDTESRPSFKKGRSNGISLLQLASSNLAAIIRVKSTGIPPALLTFLEDSSIIKVGAAIRDDLKGLKQIHTFTPRGFIDLQQVVTNYNIENVSVRKMAAIVLGGRVSKSQQLSNWEAPELTTQQVEYAATDAWVCREIYIRLLQEKPGIGERKHTAMF